jgi:hypothetical protein
MVRPREVKIAFNTEGGGDRYRVLTKLAIMNGCEKAHVNDDLHTGPALPKSYLTRDPGAIRVDEEEDEGN